ncbi:bifunctional 3'-5' exonuclease/DNA polymerase [Lysinibacter cavernae]|uniref:DNA-directed DNA polymerase n=1 Tax=Lysinibacter cavernae TaxID=1640652 RepID=A0A7X5R263_9MICO|nr:DNA polymerase-1 [Lysinibacter cavernae]
MYILVSSPPSAKGQIVLRQLDNEGQLFDTFFLDSVDFAGAVEALDEEGVRWVWSDTAHWYPGLLEQGVRVGRCHDLRLCHVILRNAEGAAGSELAHGPASAWDEASADRVIAGATLFDDLLDDGMSGPNDPGRTAALAGIPVSQSAAWAEISDEPGDNPYGDDESLAEFQRQLEAWLGSDRPGPLGLLLAAESAGALSAQEMRFFGIPWHVDVHNRILTEMLGPKPQFGGRPAKMERLAEQIRVALDAHGLNPDSPQDLLKALRRAGLDVSSTSKWELYNLKHPVIEPLLAYKKLSRLHTANGWTWLDTWVADGRFRPEYVVGGVVTGRWAAKGGGALQLPASVRGAVVADPGWSLVVADAAQLEPRILSALSGDLAMAEAGRGHDLYQALVDQGVVDTRDHAKVALLGALYGATSGQSAALMPRLTKAFPQAIRLVEEAARVGERGGIVSTWLGRSSPRPDKLWWVDAVLDSDTPAGPQRDRARQEARSWGRFTRNFVCQGSAAEWALSWLAGLRQRLAVLGEPGARPHLVYFLHDEVMVHTPEACAEQVIQAVRESAAAAGRLLFGEFPVEFPVEAVVVDNYGAAK